MKANEIPEKIYSITTEGGFYLTAIKPEPPFADGIEYTRTDAFIDKACSWMRNYVNPTAGTYLLDEDIEKFRKAMKGE